MRLLLILIIAVGIYSYHNDRDLFWLSNFTSSSQSTKNAKWLSSPRLKDVEKQPIQKNLSGTKRIKYSQGYVTLLADYQLTAKVMSTKRYERGTYGRIAPIDLALGWGPMSQGSVIRRLSVSQRERFYYYRWSGEPPIPSSQISRNSANVHILPASKEIKETILNVKAGQIVSLKGYLVNYKEGDSRSWWTVKSSLTREDTGAGACEVFYVEKVQLH